MLPTPYVASLRMYEPIETFNIKEQIVWSNSLKLSSSLFEEQKSALVMLLDTNMLYIKNNNVHVLDIAGTKYICPWTLTIRCLAALEKLRFSYSTYLIFLFIPNKIQNQLDICKEILKNKNSYVISSTWSIPPRWFALFSPEERVMGKNKNGLYLIFRTQISNAKQRAIFTHQTVSAAFGEGPIDKEISELIKWLEVFDDKSIVELDYGGLANYLWSTLISSWDTGLESDTSVEGVQLSIKGLASGDTVSASLGYERLITHWRRVADLASSN